jgi:type II secretory pathway pseudopilin PulG
MKLLPASTRRAGLALVTALVVMAALAVILAVVGAQIVAQRQMVNQRHRQLEAQWLARAGVELAAARLLEKPDAFTEEKREQLSDSKVRIVVEKLGQDLYAITAEAEVGPPDEPTVIRTATALFRRTDSDGVVRLQALPQEKTTKPG